MLIFISMNIKKIIREEIDDLKWITDIKPSLLNKIIIFEPLIDIEGFNKVKELIQVYDENVDIVGTEPDCTYIHHLLINLNGGVAYGCEFDEIPRVTTLNKLHDNIRWYVKNNSKKYENPETINGWTFFGF